MENLEMYKQEDKCSLCGSQNTFSFCQICEMTFCKDCDYATADLIEKYGGHGLYNKTTIGKGMCYSGMIIHAPVTYAIGVSGGNGEGGYSIIDKEIESKFISCQKCGLVNYLGKYRFEEIGMQYTSQDGNGRFKGPECVCGYEFTRADWPEFVEWKYINGIGVRN